MTPDQAGNNIEKTINSHVDDFASDVEKTQRNAFNKIIVLLKDIDTDSKGNVKRTSKNIRKIRSVNNELTNTIITDTYRNRVGQYLKGFSQIQNINNEYYLTFPEFASDKALYDLILQESIETASSSLLESGIAANFSEPIKDILTQNVMSGSSYSDMVEQIRLFILGNDELDGRLLAYTKQITSDSLHVYSGIYNDVITEDLGLEYVKYTGSIKDTTRPFCTQRAGKYYHRDEVKDWASLSWKGKYRGTNSSNIFHYVGGYNCRHILVAVSEAVVPQDVINRNN